MWIVAAIFRHAFATLERRNQLHAIAKRKTMAAIKISALLLSQSQGQPRRQQQPLLDVPLQLRVLT
jgi:hypothetical protein